jgi:hypothetical protein
MSDTTTTATDTANARWWLDALAVIKAGAADTGGQLTIVEVTEPPNGEAPLHVHHREDEGFLILEGRVPSTSATTSSRPAPATSAGARATSRIATWSARRAAACCSSAHPAASRTSSSA